jgi:CRP-like cAMP-binding protein
MYQTLVMGHNDLSQSLTPGYLQKIEFFDGIPREQQLILLQGTSVESVRRRQNIFIEGDSADFFILPLSGFYKLSKECEDGKKRLTLDFVCAGEMVAGLLMADPHSKFLGTLECLEGGHVLKIPRSTYVNHWSSYPDILARVQQANLRRMRSLHHLREAAAFPLEKKLAWAVIRYLKKLTGSDSLIEIKFSRKDLSELIGTTTESMIRILSAWRKTDFVVLKDNIEYFDGVLIERAFFKDGQTWKD